MSRKFFSAVLLLLVAAAMAADGTDRRVLSLYEDSAGHILKTRQVTIYANGKVFEERYDFISGKPNEVHRTAWLRSLSSQQMARIRRLLSDHGFSSLPKQIESKNGIVPDAPFREITEYTENGTERRVEWNDYLAEPTSHEAVRFTAIWNEVIKAVDAPQSNSP